MPKSDPPETAITELGPSQTIGAPPDLPTPTTALIAGRYEILALLGMGGMGRVYRARDRELDEVVALKILRREILELPGVRDRFRQEVKLARRVTSPHVVRTFDFGQHGDDHFLTMEFIDGRSLAQLLDDRGRAMPVGEAVQVARAACAGIAAAHAAGVLHRDLKPDNILVERTGRIAITDFGIARPSAAPTETQDRFVGTPAYMAPEQVGGKGAIGPPTDVYAFGAILFEMLTGRRPFVGTDLLAVAVARLLEPPPDPRASCHVPDALAELVLRCLAREPEARFADAGVVAIALAAIDSAAIPTTRPPTRATPNVPSSLSRSVAILPLRCATPELADVADGLSEEIVDALSMTRALRVRPLSSVRRAIRSGADARAVGLALGVDVVLDGTLRRISDTTIRITARAIGVADGFQLWASRFDTPSEGLLDTSDRVARDLAHALTVDLELPTRGPIDAAAAVLFLEGKAKLRASWFLYASVEDAITLLERALALLPGDPNILATLATAIARGRGFLSGGNDLPRAKELAMQALAAAPTDGEALLAVALANLYGNAIADAAIALQRALVHAPGLALAQALLGAIYLEAGALDEAIAHLEGAYQLDPSASNMTAITDLARAYVYRDRYDEAIQLLATITGSPLTEVTIGRFEMWRGRRYAMAATSIPQEIPPVLQRHMEFCARVYRDRALSAAELDEMIASVEVASPRLQVSFGQFLTEHLMAIGEPDRALAMVRRTVAAGLQDYQWLAHCPLLAPLRARPELDELDAVVRARAGDVLRALRA